MAHGVTGVAMSAWISASVRLRLSTRTSPRLFGSRASNSVWNTVLRVRNSHVEAVKSPLDSLGFATLAYQVESNVIGVPEPYR
jgi:hypothetical protein